MTTPLHRKLLARRTMIGGAGLLALLTPVLRRMDAQAAPIVAPRRVIYIFSPNGPMSESGPASGTETNFSLHDWWSPLERHKHNGVFFSHLANTGAGVVSGNGHGLGGQTFGGWGAGFGGDQYAQNGPTIDQVIARRLEAEGRGGIRPSLVWGNFANSEAGGTGDAFATEGGRNIRPTSSPKVAWNEIFSGFSAPTSNADEKARAALLLARDKSVLDFAAGDCERLRNALGSEGVRMFDEHCSTIRALEANLESNLVDGGMCAQPGDPGDRDWTNPNNIDDQSSNFADLITMTLACELSHVVAFQFGAQGARNRLADYYGVPSSPQADSGDSGPAHHPWTHQDQHSAPAKDAFRKFYQFYSEQVAQLLDRLAGTLDASGKPLLDSTLVCWLSELGGNNQNYDAHQNGSVPAFLFGGGQGTIRTGRYIRGPSPEAGSSGPDIQEAGRMSARLLLSTAHYMGLSDMTRIGSTDINGPLDLLYT